MVTCTVSCKKILFYSPPFLPPFGWYRWTHTFLWTVSKEIFQKRILQALEGLVGVACIADNILIYGVKETLDEATKDHDMNLTSL